jgi:hypothetical protein
MPFPNKDTQFKPGQSGNPKGLPKGSKSFKTRIRELLAGIGDGEWTSPIAAEYIKIIFAKNKDGTYISPVSERRRALKDVMDRLEGMPKHDIEISGNDGQPIETILRIIDGEKNEK